MRKEENAMKNKIFSRGLYVEGLRQLRLVGIIFLAILLLIGIAIPSIQYVNYLSQVNHMIQMGEPVEYSPQVMNFIEMCPLVFLIALVVSPTFTFILYSPFNKRSSSDFYHSLPYTRICMFSSFTAAILTWLAALTVIYSGVTLAIYALMPKVFIVNLVGTFDVMLTAVALSLMLVFGIIAAMSLTGTPIANITCAGLLLFLPRLLITLVTLVMGDIAPIIEGHYGIFGTDFNSLVNFIVQLFFYGDDNFYANNIASDIYSIAIALVYAVIAAILFCRRKSETSGHAAPGKKIHHVIRICVGFVVSSIVTCALISGFELEIAIVFYIVAIIIYFAYELITQKTFRTIPSTLPGLAILLGLNIAIGAICFGCAAYVHSYEPADDEISAIYIENPISNNRYHLSFSEYALEKAGSIRIEDKNAIAIAAENLRENNQRSINGNFYSYMYEYDIYDMEIDKEYVQNTELTIVYVSDMGVKRTRNIFMPVDEYTEIMEHVQTNEAYKNVFFEIPDAVNRSAQLFETYDYNYIHLTDAELNEIFESIRNEVKTLDFATWATYLASGSGYNSGFEFTYRPTNEDITLEFYFDGTILPETTSLVMEMLNKSSEEHTEILYEILSDYEAATEKYESIYINMSAIDEKVSWSLYHHYYAEDGGKNNNVSDEFAADLKAIADKSKAGVLEGDKFIIVHIEYADQDEKAEDPDVDYINYHGTVFIPYPDGFMPESDNFDVRNYEYDEEYYKYYEDTIIVG